MTLYKNPFEYEQATTLAPQFIADVFIEDHNFTRFIQSNRNVFLLGERGSGKSMTLLYNSIAVQRLRTKNNDKASDLNFIGIYIPCNTTLTHKREYELIEDQILAALISEHFMVLGIAYAIAQGMTWLSGDVSIGDDVQLREDLIYVLGADLQPEQSLIIVCG
jgi:Cdc6-like AAA superfamily ATPase